jgi:hypothetical protein
MQREEETRRKGGRDGGDAMDFFSVSLLLSASLRETSFE